MLLLTPHIEYFIPLPFYIVHAGPKGLICIVSFVGAPHSDGLIQMTSEIWPLESYRDNMQFCTGFVHYLQILMILVEICDLCTFWQLACLKVTKGI